VDDVLSVRDLSVSSPDGRDIVSDVTFEVRGGERLGLVGASGSGKSTIANALLGLLPAGLRVESGSVTVGRTEVWSDKDMHRARGRRVGLIHQNPIAALNPVRTVGAHFLEAIRAHHPGMSKSQVFERARAELKRVRLSSGADVLNQYSFELSGGMCQRVLIALTMSLDPAFVVADEPTSFLDTLVQAEIIELLRERVADAGCGLVLISHDFGVVDALADSIVVLSDGRVVERGRCADVLETPRHPVTRELISALPKLVRDGTFPERRSSRPSVGDPAVTTANLTRRFSSRNRRTPDVLALDDVSLTLRRKIITGLVGASGSGKSTLARVLCGLERIDGGRVDVPRARTGARPRRDQRAFRARGQMVFQDAVGSLSPHLTVGEAVVEPLASLGLLPPRSGRTTATSLLESVGLDPDLLDRLPHQLSGGQAQRVSIARALSARPDLLIFDESLSGLDVLARARILTTIRLLRDRDDLAILFISHDLGLVSEICDEVHVMKDGSIIESFDISDLPNMSAEYSRELLAAVPIVKDRQSTSR